MKQCVFFVRNSATDYFSCCFSGTQSSSLARHETDKAALEEKLRGPVSEVKPGKLIEEIAER